MFGCLVMGISDNLAPIVQSKPEFSIVAGSFKETIYTIAARRSGYNSGIAPSSTGSRFAPSP